MMKRGMARLARVVVAWILVFSVSAPVLGEERSQWPRNAGAERSTAARSDAVGGLRDSIARIQQPAQVEPARPIPRGYLWAGSALFVGGMAVGLYGFLNNKNGQFPEFGEAEATNKGLGTAGLAAAFAGGTILFLGARRANRAPSISVGPGRVTVSKQLAW
jgi:hypothetical protein